jgi:hypothetical protein
MDPLNNGLEWAQVGANVQNAFTSKKAEKVPLNVGFKLYKFTEWNVQRSDASVTEWWSSVDEYGADPGLKGKINMAKTLGVDVRELVHVTSAVSANWNGLSYLVIATVQEPMFAFWGQCAQQARIEPGTTARHAIGAGLTKNVPGTGWQFYIPNLTSSYLAAAAPILAEHYVPAA